MSLQQVILILQSRWRLAVAIFFAVLIPVTAINFLLPKQYSAIASVVAEPRPDPAAGQVTANLTPQAYMATQIDIIGSPRVARRVVKEMKLDEEPRFQQIWQKASQGRGEIDDFIAGLLKRKLAVQPSGESNVISISVLWPDAKGAAAIANAFAQSYLDTSIELTIQPANRYASSFSHRADALRAELQAKQKLLTDFESENGLVVTDERLDVEQSRLAELSTELVAIQNQRQESQSRQRQASNSAESTPEVLQNPVIISLKADLARAQAKQDDLATRLGTNHPEYVSVAAEVVGLHERIDAERARIINSLADTTLVHKGRERDVVAAIAAQKQRIIELKHQHDQAQILQNDVLTAQRNLDAVTQRLAQSSLEGQTEQTNLAILTPAVEPLEPTSPKILLNCMLAALAGAGLGVGAALLRERMDRRVRVESEFGAAFNVPVLGRIKAIPARAGRPKNLALPRYEPSAR